MANLWAELRDGSFLAGAWDGRRAPQGAPKRFRFRKGRGRAGGRRPILLFLFLFLLLAFARHAEAAGISIQYDGKKTTYDGTHATATLDGKKISMGETPGIILDDTCMLPLKDVFVSGLGMSYDYDSEKGKITLRQDGVTVKMTLKSKTAYLNGDKKTLDVAPRRIKFVDLEQTKVYVPSRFVAESFGYGYEWSSSDHAAKMTSPLTIRYASDWFRYLGTKGKVTYNGKEVHQSDMPSISVDGTTLIRAKKVFADAMGLEYEYDGASKTVTLRRNDVTVEMTIDSATAVVNGKSYEMRTPARMVENKENGKSYVMVPGSFAAKKLGYAYSWDSGEGTSVITRIPSDYASLSWKEGDALESGENMVTNLTVSHEEGIDVLSMTGIDDLDVSLSESADETELYLDVDNVFHDVDAVKKTFTDGVFAKGIRVKRTSDGLSVTLTKSKDCSYYTSQSGTDFHLILCENITTDVESSAYQMKMTLPKGSSISDISDEDRYYDKTILLTLKGNHVRHFSDYPILYDDSVVKSVDISLTSSKNTRIKIVTKKLQGYRLVDCGDYVGIRIADPDEIYERIVVLDAGHGGKDPGASGHSAKEKSLNLTILHDVAKNYFNEDGSGIKAYWTRTDDTFIPLEDRASFASKVKADLFVSLHMNSAANASARGMEVLYGANNKHTMSGLNSKAMADIFRKELISSLGMADRGVINRPNLVVLKHNTVPAVLIELGFISNHSDFQKISSASFQKKTAAAIFRATKACFEQYPTGR